MVGSAKCINDIRRIHGGKTGVNERYSHDALDRLTSSTGPWGTITYTCDGVGNRLTMVENGTITTNYTYGSYNRLSQAGTVIYTCDGNGNMITKNDGNSWTYTHEYDNRLTRVQRNSSTMGDYYYDGDGIRETSASNPWPDEYVWFELTA